MIELADLELRGKRTLVRVDFNVPIKNKMVRDDYRIQVALPTIKYIVEQGASVILVSHLGRPAEGVLDPTLSLEPVARVLSNLLQEKVTFQKNWINGLEIPDAQIVLCENVRFLTGESKNDKALAKKMAGLCDIFVNDAFSCAHRLHVSTYGIASFAPVACAGPLLIAEINALTRVLTSAETPIVAIVGGAKVSTKINLLENLAPKVDSLIAGGGIANSLLKALGYNVGYSLVEKESSEIAARLINTYSNIILPQDVVCAKEFSENAIGKIKNIDEIEKDDQILDFGPLTMKNITMLINNAKTVLWNGPLGVFEFSNFENGTKTLSESIANSTAFSVAGGGDTLAAIEKYGISDDISYISTGGGAFLEFLGGKILPSIEILQKRA